MSYPHFFPSISHTFHCNFTHKYITFCKVIYRKEVNLLSVCND